VVSAGCSYACCNDYIYDKELLDEPCMVDILLAAGILLIAIGAMNEMKKQNVGKSIGKKLTRFMSDWTW
jgi:hypothetical protein